MLVVEMLDKADTGLLGGRDGPLLTGTVVAKVTIF